jgi:hypothetical protein
MGFPPVAPKARPRTLAGYIDHKRELFSLLVLMSVRVMNECELGAVWSFFV